MSIAVSECVKKNRKQQLTSTGLVHEDLDLVEDAKGRLGAAPERQQEGARRERALAARQRPGVVVELVAGRVPVRVDADVECLRFLCDAVHLLLLVVDVHLAVPVATGQHFLEFAEGVVRNLESQQFSN